jgi:hypothetical protein
MRDLGVAGLVVDLDVLSGARVFVVGASRSGGGERSADHDRSHDHGASLEIQLFPLGRGAGCAVKI